jgi:putative RNA 2'-phosphotransferase
MKKDLKSASKFLALVLRHKPEKIGITLDRQGWAKVSEIKAKTGYSQKLLEDVVAGNDKKRYAFNHDKTMIRANWGHSVNVQLALEPSEPPDILYHGTATRFKDSILDSGIEKRGRDHVHLSTDTETAESVGSRHGSPFIFEVDAKQMHADGFEFYLSTNVNIWLTDHIPPEYLKDEDTLTDIIESPINFSDL